MQSLIPTRFCSFQKCAVPTWIMVVLIFTLFSLWTEPVSCFISCTKGGTMSRNVLITPQDSTFLISLLAQPDEEISSPTDMNDSRVKSDGGVFGGIQNFFKQLDAFVDDATNRRLGNGSYFYGKRKSTFYGEEDKAKKMDMDKPDPTEDYQGPSKAGYFQWIPDEDGQLRPVTRMRKTNIERNPNYWDRVYDDKNEDE